VDFRQVFIFPAFLFLSQSFFALNFKTGGAPEAEQHISSEQRVSDQIANH
jgi:hypothetical protein